MIIKVSLKKSPKRNLQKTKLTEAGRPFYFLTVFPYFEIINN